MHVARTIRMIHQEFKFSVCSLNHQNKWLVFWCSVLLIAIWSIKLCSNSNCITCNKNVFPFLCISIILRNVVVQKIWQVHKSIILFLILITTTPNLVVPMYRYSIVKKRNRRKLPQNWKISPALRILWCNESLWCGVH